MILIRRDKGFFTDICLSLDNHGLTFHCPIIFMARPQVYLYLVAALSSIRLSPYNRYGGGMGGYFKEGGGVVK